MKIDNTASGLKTQIENEIQQYLTEQVELSDGNSFSQHKLVRRIALFESKTYPTGKIDSQGNYKFWYDIITPRIDTEVKNIDFDTSNISVYSPRKIDELPCLITNLKLTEYLRETGQAEEINSAIEEGAGWGNVLWKKVRGFYERCDLRNTYIINQTARDVDETPIIERHPLSQSDLRAKAGKWANVKEVIEGCGTKTYKSESGGVEKETTVPYYEIYERNGEVSLKDLKLARGEEPSDADADEYVFAKVIAAGTKGQATGVSIEYILFAEEMPGKSNAKIYKEYHRGRYKGRWWREGLYELLMDHQVRANQIGNQIAQGLEHASKQFYVTEDKLIVQNTLSDMRNGDIIRAKNLAQVETRLNGFDQLLADWNRNLESANEVANSHDVAMGINPTSGTPLGTTEMLNQNVGKLHDFIREKFSIPFREMFESWIIPSMVKELSKPDEIIRLTGDSTMLERLMALVVDDWYVMNLIAIGPHSPEEGIMLKTQKMQELQSRPQLLIEGLTSVFKGFAPSAAVNITGENSTQERDLKRYSDFINLEQDPIRRSHMVEKAMKRAGMDVGDLPRSTPEQLSPPTTPAPGAPAVQ